MRLSSLYAMRYGTDPRRDAERGGRVAARTGRSLPEWVALVQASGIDPLDQRAVRGWLRSEHGLPQNSQWAIADAAARGRLGAAYRRRVRRPSVHRPEGRAAPDLRALAAALSDLGEDVTIEGRSTYIPFVRRRQFAAIAPVARDRVDLGLRFTDPPPAGRAEPATSPGQATHKVSLGSVREIDDESTAPAENRLRAERLSPRADVAFCVAGCRAPWSWLLASEPIRGRA